MKMTKKKSNVFFMFWKKSAHIETSFPRIVHGVDITTLMTVADDVAVGDISLEGLFTYY